MRAPDFWISETPAARAAALILSPLAAAYRLGAAWKRRNAEPFRPKTRVLCIGNLTAGGTGKTPIALALASKLRTRGMKPVFLSRGYGGILHGPTLVVPARHTAEAVGDEALLLEREAPVIVARDRASGAGLADTHGADVIIMDDGFQNPSVYKDVSIIVVDGQTGFGNGHLLPAGPLREPVATGLARADAVVITGDGKPELPSFSGPILTARLEPIAPDSLRGKKLYAFAGIGRPEKFFETLRAMGADIVATRAFADHHRFTDAELWAMRSEAQSRNVILITTEKDFVRLKPGAREGLMALPVRAVFDDDAVLGSVLDRLMLPRKEQPA